MKPTLGLIFMALLAVGGQTRAAEPLDVRLGAIEDRQAIDQLLTGDYPRALDLRQWPDYAALFTADGELTFAGRTLKGPAEIEKFFNTFRVSSSTPPPRPGEIRTLHVVSNLSFRIEGDTAVGGAYWETIGVTEGRPAVLSAGRYEDVLKKEHGRWKFAKRAIVSDLAPRTTTPAPGSGTAPADPPAR